MRPLDRLEANAQALIDAHSPIWNHPPKKVIYQIGCPRGSTHHGRIEYARWPSVSMPESIELHSISSRIAERPGFYDYVPIGHPDAVEWHVNFSDPQLFVAYGSPLFAQDEMQVAEHPALGALREALVARGLHPVTVENAPTPVTIMGVERRCTVRTDPNPGEGRPHGLYGNAFARADESAVRRATTPIDPPTVTNLICMAAPNPSRGSYTDEQVRYVLITASSAFTAAVLESERSFGPGTPIVVHTGFWGCGAFGGNRVLMTVLQAIAATMAEVERIVFHTGDATGAAVLEDARRWLENNRIAGRTTADTLIEQIVAAGFEWGSSDGN